VTPTKLIRRHVPAMRCFLAALRDDCRAVTIIEFALVMPLLLTMLLGGLELANLVITHTRVNQIALALADNSSRMKQETVGGAPRIRESDVNQAFTAAELQGQYIDLLKHGRLILSSLETNASDGQTIHWQRCSGSMKTLKSIYGVEGTGKTGTAFKGVEASDTLVTAQKDAAVMVAEVVYEYQPLIADGVMDKMTIRKVFAMYVRDDRDLTGAGIWPATGVTASTC
jgi:Flp pilus assembly protein TadG